MIEFSHSILSFCEVSWWKGGASGLQDFFFFFSNGLMKKVQNNSQVRKEGSHQVVELYHDHLWRCKFFLRFYLFL